MATTTNDQQAQSLLDALKRLLASMSPDDVKTLMASVDQERAAASGTGKSAGWPAGYTQPLAKGADHEVNAIVKAFAQMTRDLPNLPPATRSAVAVGLADARRAIDAGDVPGLGKALESIQRATEEAAAKHRTHSLMKAATMKPMGAA